MPTEAWATTDDSRMTLLPLPRIGKQLLHEKERCAHIHREEAVEIFDGRLFDGGRFRDARIGDEDIEAAADDGAHLFRQRVRAFGRGEIGLHRIGARTELADFSDDLFGFLGLLP